MRRLASPVAVASTGVIAVIRADRVDKECRGVIDTLIGIGVLGIELTMTTGGVLRSLRSIVDSAPSEAAIGVGTITDATQVAAVAEAGGQFVVTPTVNAPVIDEATRYGMSSYPGAFTPTEILGNWDAGATAVKLFPASTVGPSFIGHVHGPFPGIALVPSGGVTLDDIPAWIRAGAVAVSLGGPLLGDAMTGGSLASLRDRGRRALAAVQDAR